MSDPIPQGYKPWLIASTVVLVGSLGVLAVAVVGASLSYGQVGLPLWVVLVGAAAGFGILVGFGGLFLLLAVAGWTAWKEGKKVQVIPPERL